MSTSADGKGAVQLKQTMRAPRGPQFASQLGNPVPASVIVTYNGLEWVHASPCSQNGCTSGILVGKDGFEFATAAEWAIRPPIEMFAGKCASPWFDQTWDHCDYSDLQYGYYGSTPTGGSGPVGPIGTPYSWNETLLVRGAVPSDDTAPSITPNIVGTLGNNDWYTSDINISWTVTDGESPISSQTGCDASVVDSNTGGVTFTCSATSDGGTASVSVTVKRDATVPSVTYSGNAGSYTVADNVAITCSAGDDLSGVASDTCADISGAAYTFALGLNSFSASATDNAGNVGSGSAEFTVTVSHASLCALTQSLVSHNGTANSLCAKLNAAAASAARGNSNAANNQLAAYINEVEAQSGKKIAAADATILIALANAL